MKKEPPFHTLSVPLEIVSVLEPNPGDRHFVLWFVISSFFPLISACTAPLANVISLTGLVDHWRIDRGSGKMEPDPPGLLALNVLSFVFGIIGNISLLCNFSGSVHYLISQAVSIGCWLVALMLLLSDVVITYRHSFYEGSAYTWSEGFWFGVFTVVLYFTCAVMLSINYIGFFLHKYPAKLNLTRKQSLLLVYTMVLAIWLMVGTLSFSHLIPDISYGASLYFCTVAILTVGLGDIVPQSSGARAFTLVYLLFGVVLLGLIVTFIRRVVVSSGVSVWQWHMVERSRQAHYDRVVQEDWNLGPEDAFNIMHDIRHHAKQRLLRWLFVTVLGVWVATWLVAALVFHLWEGWTYFEAVYFCMLCLITIGFGDFAPSTPFGRAFFVVWAISEVPFMTILISNMADSIFAFAELCVSYLSSFLTEEEEVSDEPSTSSMLTLQEQVHALKLLVRDTLENPTKRYTHDEWVAYYAEALSPTFWLGDSSPLRLPLKEPHFLVLRQFERLEDQLTLLPKQD